MVKSATCVVDPFEDSSEFGIRLKRSQHLETSQNWTKFDKFDNFLIDECEIQGLDFSGDVNVSFKFIFRFLKRKSVKNEQSYFLFSKLSINPRVKHYKNYRKDRCLKKRDCSSLK